MQWPFSALKLQGSISPGVLSRQGFCAPQPQWSLVPTLCPNMTYRIGAVWLELSHIQVFSKVGTAIPIFSRTVAGVAKSSLSRYTKAGAIENRHFWAWARDTKILAFKLYFKIHITLSKSIEIFYININNIKEK